MISEKIKMEPGASRNAEWRPSVFCKNTEDIQRYFRIFKRVAGANDWSEARQLSVLPALFTEEAEWVAEELESAAPTSVEQAEQLAVRLLCSKEKRKTRMTGTGDRQPAVGGLRCFTFGGVGHFQRECSSRREVRKLSTNRESEVKVRVTIGGMSSVGVLDTGSAVNLLSEEEVQELGLDMHQKDYIQCVAANGNTVQVCGLVDAPIVVGKASVEHTFHVARNLAGPLLLGMDILKKLNIVILLRLVNRTDEEILIPAGTVLGHREELEIAELAMPEVAGNQAAESVQEPRSTEQETLQACGGQLEYGSSGGAPSGTLEEEVSNAAGTYRLPEVGHVPEPYQSQLQQMLVEYRDVFSQSNEDIGRHVGDKVMSIDTGDAKPICQRAYRTPFHVRDEMKNKLEGMLQQGVVVESHSPWASPVVLVKKKNGDLRFCCDFRAVNTVRIMEDMLGEQLQKQAVVYLDDVILFTDDLSSHLKYLKETLDKYRSHGLKLNPHNCLIAKTEVDFLGHRVSCDGIRPSATKLEALESWPTPRTSKELRTFLGFAGYYHHFVPGFSQKAAPLTDLLQKGKDFNWSEECDRNFKQLKEDLQSYSVLQCLRIEEEFTLTTDASLTGWGAELRQPAGVIAFASGKWNSAESNRSVTERELTAVVKAVTEFRHYILGKHFTLRTDHEAIKYLQRSRVPSGRLFRWLELLQDYDFVMEHVPGRVIPHVDALSRRPSKGAPTERPASQLRPTAPEFKPKSRQEREEKEIEGKRTEEPADTQASRAVIRETRILDDEELSLAEEVGRDPVLSLLKSALQGKAIDPKALTSDQRKELEFYQRMDGLMLKQGLIWAEDIGVYGSTDVGA
ncbi:uncharacterized protein LOC122388488 [Amphibalanus amphitrite]|uniref:uncharacterized protein LOC122388488 n=1 Tax=Amphibalanus amphitrite TaxID=1232801 RepID=UPI001C91C588|nr:uncharacterized protein LOC122388488 [Amphibalanus amphitrite]